MIADYWNHNVHYQHLVLDAVPAGCRDALDVGCGDGLLAAKLAAKSERVTALDRDAGMVRIAKERCAALPGVSVLQGDFLDHQGEYDFICSVATIHHMDFTAALTHMAGLLRPGGTLMVLGIGKDRRPADFLRAVPAIPVTHFLRLRHRRKSNPGFPVMDPAMGWSEIRDTALRLLPGARYTRHLLWRYSIFWRKGESAA